MTHKNTVCAEIWTDGSPLILNHVIDLSRDEHLHFVFYSTGLLYHLPQDHFELELEFLYLWPLYTSVLIINTRLKATNKVP